MSWGSASGNWAFCRVNRVVPERWTLGAFPSISEMSADCIHRGALTPQRAGTFPIDPDAVMAWADKIAQVNSIEVARDRNGWRVRLDNKRSGTRECFQHYIPPKLMAKEEAGGRPPSFSLGFVQADICR